jgi:hypothetical protein
MGLNRAATALLLRTPAGRAAWVFLERDLGQADACVSVERAQAGRRRVARRRDLPSAGITSGDRAGAP